MLGTIKDVDLIAAELEKHSKYYWEYTRIIFETNNKKEIKELEPVYKKGDFESACKTIKNEIINQGKCISIQTLLNTRKKKKSRQKKVEILFESKD